MSKFIEKHKRKSLLATLLFIFKGRGKYIALLVMIIGLSLPFIMTSEMTAKFLDLPPVASFLKTVGLDSVFSRFIPKYDNNRNLIKNALSRYSYEDDSKYSVWQKIMNNMAGFITKGEGSIAMIRGGEDWYKRYKVGPDGVKGIVSDEEKEKGLGADAVDFQDYLANSSDSKNGEGNNLYNDINNLNGFNKMRDMGFGSGGEYGPYLSKSSFYSKNGTIQGGSNVKEGMLAKTLASTNIPTPKDPKTGKIKKQKTGAISGFSWKNVGYKKKGDSMDVRINSSRRAMFQASETFTMTSSAYKGNSAYEHQAAYVGSTYDGNNVNADVIQTDSAPSMPDTAYTGDLMASAGGWAQMAEDCAKANETEGAKISEYEKKMTDLAPQLANKPKCCNHGAVDNYNNNVVEKMRSYCLEVNKASTALGASCQNSQPQLHNCNEYNGMRVNKCSKWKCFLGALLGALLIIIGALLTIFTAGIGAAIGIGLMIAGGSMILGQMMGGMIGMVLGLVGGLVASFFVGPAALVAVSAATYVGNEAATKWGATESGTNTDDNN